MTKRENFMLAQRCIDNIKACLEEVENDELRETILNLTDILRKRVIDIYCAESPIEIKGV